jgi:hypothetical protein
MELYNKINNFQLDDSYLFFDIFCRNNELIVITPIINHNNLNHMTITHNNSILDRIQVLKTDWIVVQFYHVNINMDKIISIIVEFNNNQKQYDLQHLMICKQYGLIQSTLFKDDNYLLPKFTSHYNGLGVEYYYLYYNDKNDKLEKLNFTASNVTLIEWDYQYYFMNQKGFGHAQAGQLNHSLYKYAKVLGEYILYNDLDEYIQVNLNKLIKNITIDTFMFRNVWADTIIEPTDMNDYYKMIGSELTIPKEYCVNLYANDNGHHSKCIHKTSSIYLIQNIHCGEYYNTSKNVFSDNLYMLHFFRWVPPHIDHHVRERKDVRFIYFATK